MGWTTRNHEKSGSNPSLKLAVEIQSSEKFPQLARDGTNLEYSRVGQRTRKNRHGRRKHIVD